MSDGVSIIAARAPRTKPASLADLSRSDIEELAERTRLLSQWMALLGGEEVEERRFGVVISSVPVARILGQADAARLFDGLQAARRLLFLLALEVGLTAVQGSLNLEIESLLESLGEIVRVLAQEPVPGVNAHDCREGANIASDAFANVGRSLVDEWLERFRDELNPEIENLRELVPLYGDLAGAIGHQSFSTVARIADGEGAGPALSSAAPVPGDGALR